MDDVHDAGGLTPFECNVMELLVDAWNLWSNYAQESGFSEDVVSQFRDGIHQCQGAMGQVALSRMFPDFWRK